MPEQKVTERDPVCGMQVDPATVRAKSECGAHTLFLRCGLRQKIRSRCAAVSGATCPGFTLRRHRPQLLRLNLFRLT